LGRGVAAIRGRNDEQEFADWLIHSYLEALLQKTTGSVFPNLSSGDIRGLRVIDPAINLRRAF
jgi:restriction endonuclease S subunit